MNLGRCMYYCQTICAIMLGLVSLGGVTYATGEIVDARLKPLLYVHTIERKPFVIEKDMDLSGFSIELREEIARRGGYMYTFKLETVFSDMIDAVKNNTADVAIANISITSEREEFIDFSYPIFDSGLRMITKKEDSGTSYDIKQLLSLGILILLGLYTTLWLSFSLKTATGRQRLLYFIGIAGSLLFSVLLGNSLQSILHGNNEVGGDDFQDISSQGFSIGIAEGTTMSRYFDTKGIPYTPYNDYSSALEAVESGVLDITVGDAPVVERYAANEGKNKIQLIGRTFAPDKIAIAFQEDSIFVEQVNTILLEMMEDGTYKEIKEKYFGK